MPMPSLALPRPQKPRRPARLGVCACGQPIPRVPPEQIRTVAEQKKCPACLAQGARDFFQAKRR